MTDPIHKNAAILEHIDQVVKDLLHTLKIIDERERETHVKSVLFYWLGVLFDDGANDSANLLVALDAARDMMSKLRETNEKLREQARSALKKTEEI